MSTISTLCRAVHFVVEGAQVVDKFLKYSSMHDGEDFKYGYLTAGVTQGIACCLNAICASAESSGAAPKTLSNIKSSEAFVRMVDYVASSASVFADVNKKRTERGYTTLADYVEFGERGLLATMTSVVRALQENTLLLDKRYLAMSPEELAKERIYADEDGKFVARPVLREDCLKRAEWLPSAITKARFIETAARIGACTHTVNCLEEFSHSLREEGI